MKRILFACFAAVLALGLHAQNINDLEAFEKAMKPGTTLTYDVTVGTKKYQFIATVKQLGEQIAFDWKMTEPVNKMGSVVMAPFAVAKAEAMYNFLAEGPVTLTNETSIWISRKLYNDIAANAAAPIKINGQSDTATAMSNTINEFNFNLDGQLVALPGWELQGGDNPKSTIDVIESTRFPIIYKMDIGWTIVLTEVKSK